MSLNNAGFAIQVHEDVSPDNRAPASGHLVPKFANSVRTIPSHTRTKVTDNVTLPKLAKIPEDQVSQPDEPKLWPSPLRIRKKKPAPTIVNERLPVIPCQSPDFPDFDVLISEGGLTSRSSRSSSLSSEETFFTADCHRPLSELRAEDLNKRSVHVQPSGRQQQKSKGWKTTDTLVVRKQRSSPASPHTAATDHADDGTSRASPLDSSNQERRNGLTGSPSTNRVRKTAPMTVIQTIEDVSDNCNSPTSSNSTELPSSPAGERPTRDPSTRTRVLAHFLGGLDVLNRPGLSRATPPSTTDETAPEAHRGSSSVEDNLDTTDSGHRPTWSTSTTSTASQTELGSRSTLEDTLNAFPLPPGVRALEVFGADKEVLSREHPPVSLLQPAVLAARIRCIPEMESLSTEGTQSMWVGIEVSGEVSMVPAPSSGSSPGLGLEVVICIDNGAYTSPSALDLAKDITVLLASILDVSRDRIGVRPYVHHRNNDKRCGLSPVNSERLRKELEDIRLVEGDHPREAAWEDILQRASGLFTTRPHHTPPSSSDPRAHIFLISPYPGKCSFSSSTSDPHITVHTINPALFPWPQHGDRPRVNGYTLHSSYRPFSRTRSSSSSSSTPPTQNPSSVDDLPYLLKNLLQHARHGTHPGRLTNVKVSLTPRTGCTFAEIWGKTRTDTLGPGESVMIFVKVQVPPYEPAREVSISSSSTFASSSSASASVSRLEGGVSEGPNDFGAQDHQRLFNEVDVLLGEATTSILSVRVNYRHSFFPPDTRISVETSATVRRHAPHTPWHRKIPTPSSSSSSAPSESSPQETLHRHLMVYLASRHRPGRALEELSKVFGKKAVKGTRPVGGCRGFLRLVVAELKWRGGVVEWLRRGKERQMEMEIKVEREREVEKRRKDEKEETAEMMEMEGGWI
ncbi:MAG: hypothetical protein M1817_002054 [Caeruleum heppii]|nr:MAG: hypothetical protein M1817_002054 [Caeruleum heppii]